MPDEFTPVELNEFGQAVGFAMPGWKPPPAPRRENLSGRYCRLEPLIPARHAGDLWNANSEEASGRSWTWLPYGPFASYEEYDAWLQAYCLGDDPLFFAIIDLATGRALGVISYLRIAPGAGTIEIGHLQYAPALRRGAAAAEAMFLLMSTAFDLGYRRVEWKCDALNAPSRAAARRYGFSFEGIFRQALVYKQRNRDTAWYAMINTDWPAIRDAFQAWLDPSNFDATGMQRTRLSERTREHRHAIAEDSAGASA